MMNSLLDCETKREDCEGTETAELRTDEREYPEMQDRVICSSCYEKELESINCGD